MSEEESELLHEMNNEFWENYSKLIGETLSKLPDDLHDDALVIMQDASSVYGSCYKKYLKN